VMDVYYKICMPLFFILIFFLAHIRSPFYVQFQIK